METLSAAVATATSKLPTPWQLYQLYEAAAAEAARAHHLIKQAATMALRIGGRALVGAAGVLAAKVLFDLAVEMGRLKQLDPDATTLAILWRAVCKRIQALLDWFGEMLFTTAAEPSASSRRRVLSEIAVPEVVPQADHPHPECAAVRSSADRMVIKFAVKLGADVYHEQLNHGQIERGKKGRLTHKTYRDFHSPEQESRRAPNQVRYFRDDDYYLDMNTELTDHVNPTVLYTMVPEDAGWSGEEYSYTFDPKGRLIMTVAGAGPMYEHRLYDYGCDRLVCHPKYPWRQSVVYHVERRRIARDRQLIFLFPDVYVSPFTRACTWLARRYTWLPLPDLMAGMRELCRFDPIQHFVAPSHDIPFHTSPEDIPGFLEASSQHYCRFKYQTPEGMITTTACCGSYAATTLDSTVDSSIVASSFLTKAHFNLATASSHGADASKTFLIPLTLYLKAGGTATSAELATGPAPVLAYQYVTKADPYVPDSKATLYPIITPVIANDTFAPSRTTGNAKHAVIKRMDEVRSDARPSEQQLKHMDEMIDFMLAAADITPGTMEPATMEEVQANIKTRQARVAFEKWAEQGDCKTDVRDVPASGFIKAEPYASTKAPRVIVNVQNPEKFQSASIWMPIAKMCKAQPWYGFCPIDELETKVVDAFGPDQPKEEEACPLGVPIDSDGKFWDGRYSLVARVFEEKLLLRAYHPRHHPAIVHELKCTHGKIVWFDEFFYVTEWNQLSGRAATSGGNSVFNRFISYDAVRTGSDELGGGPGYSPKAAWQCGCLFGGDDGVQTLFPGESGVRYVRAAERAGMQFELGAPGRVHFLGRYWSVGSGFANSCASLRRCLRNLGVATTPMPDVDARRLKLIEKLYSLWLTDRNTPGIKQLVALIPPAYTELALDGSGKIHVPLTADTSYWAAQSSLTKKYFTNVADEWMLDPEVCGLDSEELDQLFRWLRVITLDGLLDMRRSPLQASEIDLASVPLCLEGSELPRQRKPAVDLDSKPIPSEAVCENSEPVSVNNDNNKPQPPTDMRKCGFCAETKPVSDFSVSQRKRGPEGRCITCTTTVAAANGATITCSVCNNTQGEDQFPAKQLLKPKPKCRKCCDRLYLEVQEKEALKTGSAKKPVSAVTAPAAKPAKEKRNKAKGTKPAPPSPPGKAESNT